MLDEFSKTLINERKKGVEVAPAWFTNSGETLPLDPTIIHSDVLDGYRNKVEFTVGRGYLPPRPGTSELWNPEGPVVVGFNRTNLSRGISFVENPEIIRVNSRQSVAVAKTFEELIRSCPGAEYSPFDKARNKGFWRILLYRESKTTKQVLICVVVSKATLENPVPPMSSEIKEKLVAKFGSGTELEGGLRVVSLSVITSDDLTGGYKEGDDWEILSGGGHYEEILCGLRFTVSPFAFFQVNTLVFEKMLALITEFAGIDSQTVLFDICCGTGAIGLCLSKNAKKVIGVELIEQAVENARHNVLVNSDQLLA